MKKSFKLLSLVLASLTIMSTSSSAFAAPNSNNKVTSTCKKVLKYGLIGAGATAATLLTAAGAYKLFSSKPAETEAEPESESESNGKTEIEINSEEDFEQIKNCKDTLVKAKVNVYTIPPFAFNFCTKLKEVDLSGVKFIKQLAFFNCHELETVTNSSNVEFIGTCAFSSCPAIRELNFPGVKTVNHYTFYYCNSLKTINLANIERVALPISYNLTEHDSYISEIVYKCPSLEEMILPENIKNIDHYFCNQFQE